SLRLDLTVVSSSTKVRSHSTRSAMNTQQFDLVRALAAQAMFEHGFLVSVPPDARRQAETAAEPPLAKFNVRDLTAWLWSSIDNDDSRDLDQLEYAQAEAKGTRVYVAIANVNWFVPKGS